MRKEPPTAFLVAALVLFFAVLVMAFGGCADLQKQNDQAFWAEKNRWSH